jgi:phage terminase small subunit
MSKAIEVLTGKQRAFINAYLGEAKFNATEAARIAGYKGDDVTLAAVGYENLRKPQIEAEVRARFNEATMSANEVLARLTEIASGRITDFLDEDGAFSLKVTKQRGKEHLLKKLKIKRTAKKVDSIESGREDERETLETSLVHEDVELEMYSAHEALRDLGKFHKLFAERIEHSNPDGSPLGQPIAEALAKVYGSGATGS